MTSNVPPPSAAPGGRRRALGRGPGSTPVPPEEPEVPQESETPEAPEPPEVPGPSQAAEPSESEAAEPYEVPEPSGASEPSALPAGPSAAPARTPGTDTEPPGHGEGAPTQAPAAALESRVTEVPRTAEPPEGPAEPSGAPVERPARTARPLDPPAPSEAPQGDPAPSASAPAGASAPVEPVPDPGPDPGPDAADSGVFKVRLSNFEGPFDLLLQLISKHKLDVTEVALSQVTDEFMAHIRAMGPDWDLDQTTEFLVVAATLLDLKAARLLPAAEVEDEADLALLEARDLLFARLLQYRAYKQIADIFNTRLAEESRRYPRTVGLEAQYAELLPEVVISIGPEGFARLAVKAMQPKPKPQVYVDHIHAPLVSVQEQAGIVVARLRELGEASFRSLVEDTDDTLTVVARFLALLELYREKAVALDQEEALGDLLVRWTGGEGEGTPRVTDEFDRPAEAAKDGAGRGSEKEKT
ncbi:segregation/condensation protein A [Streptomyces aureus]